jgi:hypothetical protein
MTASCDSEERWIPVKCHVTREYIHTAAGWIENTDAIGRCCEVTLPESFVRTEKEARRQRRAEGVAYGIQTPDGSELVAVGRKAYHRWITRFQDKFGPDAEFRIRSIRLKSAKGA